MFEAREELMVKERMNLEMDDYPGTGANNHHDPNAPGRVWLMNKFIKFYWNIIPYACHVGHTYRLLVL